MVNCALCTISYKTSFVSASLYTALPFPRCLLCNVILLHLIGPFLAAVSVLVMQLVQY